jgi:3-phenylpropionate/trans-cinnamate dioxygenase ferredoxin subunit
MAKYVVATVDEIPPGERKIVQVGGRSIGIFNAGGEFFALRNQCPHEGGPLCEGYLSGFVTSKTPGEYQYSRKGEILRCPWHAWEFDIRTGQSWFDPAKTRVRRYEVHVAPGSALAAATGESAAAGLQPGPYVAETYPVSVEKDYIMLDMGPDRGSVPAAAVRPTPDHT